jgi:hypothetical protein
MTTSRLAQNHPSYLALDRASLGEPSPSLEAHLETCVECRDYVAALAEPPPASGFVRVQQQVEAERRSRRRGWFMLLPAAAAAAGALLFIGVRPQPELPAGPRGEPPYVGTKGFTSVWIYVKHGTTTELWDGKRPVFAGDRLRLKLDPGRFRHVAVYSVKGPDSPALLYAGNVTPGESTTLPEAWEVDGEPGAERLVVAFSNQALEPAWPDWLQGKAPPGVTVLPFVLPKSSSPDPDAGSTSP